LAAVKRSRVDDLREALDGILTGTIWARAARRLGARVAHAKARARAWGERQRARARGEYFAVSCMLCDAEEHGPTAADAEDLARLGGWCVGGEDNICPACCAEQDRVVATERRAAGRG
jgi:hypothetical protein